MRLPRRLNRLLAMTMVGMRLPRRLNRLLAMTIVEARPPLYIIPCRDKSGDKTATPAKGRLAETKKRFFRKKVAIIIG